MRKDGSYEHLRDQESETRSRRRRSRQLGQRLGQLASRGRMEYRRLEPRWKLGTGLESWLGISRCRFCRRNGHRSGGWGSCITRTLPCPCARLSISLSLPVSIPLSSAVGCRPVICRPFLNSGKWDGGGFSAIISGQHTA